MDDVVLPGFAVPNNTRAFCGRGRVGPERLQSSTRAADVPFSVRGVRASTHLPPPATRAGPGPGLGRGERATARAVLGGGRHARVRTPGREVTGEPGFPRADSGGGGVSTHPRGIRARRFPPCV